MENGFKGDLGLIVQGIRSNAVHGVGDSRKFQALGAEREMFIIDRQGRFGKCADQLVDATGQPWCASEFPVFACETTSDRLEVNAGVFQRLWEQMRRREGAVREKLNEISPTASLVAAGVLPSLLQAELHLGEDIVSQRKPRYMRVMQRLQQRHGGYTFAIPTTAGNERKVYSPTSPLVSGLTCGFSPNVQFHPKTIGLAYDIAVALAWVSPFLSSTSPLALGDRAAWNSRYFVWSYGIAPDKALTPFGPGSYLNIRGVEVIWKWLNFLQEREPILEFGDTDIDPCSLLATTSLRCGTTWVQAARLRPCIKDDALVVHMEIRSPDCGLTLFDDVADAALLIGANLGLQGKIDSAAEIMPYDLAERTYVEIATKGSADVPWFGNANSARRVLLDGVIPLAREGLAKEGICDKTIGRLLQSCARRIERNQTGADWMLGSFERNRHDAAKVMLELGGLQATQPLSFNEAVSVADWF